MKPTSMRRAEGSVPYPGETSIRSGPGNGNKQLLKKNSRRFEWSQWTECLVPALLLVLLLALVATMLVVALALLGLTPAV